MNDPIIDEVRRVRDAHAARFHYDLDAIFQDIKSQEQRSDRLFVSFTPLSSVPLQEFERIGTREVPQAPITD